MASTLSFIISAALLCGNALAAPSVADVRGRFNSLKPRDNNWHLKCSNAPSHEGGYALDPAEVTNPLPDVLPQTGSDERGMAYMWCTPGTSTYTFFSQLYLDPAPGDAYYFAQAVNSTVTQFAGQTDHAIADNSFSSAPDQSNVQIHMEGARGGTLTWGIANAALRGISEFYNAYTSANINNTPIIFQVNDREWGEVAIGYVAYLRPSDQACIIQIYQGKELPCSELKKNIV